tara:strand:- start:201 stop:971 length:771 start_codon:yes stop_codon:yes gene_type:complete
MTSGYNIAIRSYKRSGKVTALKVFPDAKIWIPESQREEYAKEYGTDVLVVIPDNEDGNSPRKFNAILNRMESDYQLIVDDDITGIYKFEGTEDPRPVYMQPEDIRDLITRGFRMAEELGTPLWGINLNRDPVSYVTYKPFNFLSAILGPFSGHIRPSLRYDESTLSKDDYDFWLQNILKYRKTLRFNKYHYHHKHGVGTGGLASIRSIEYEERGAQRMREKWGTRIFKRPTTAAGRHAGRHVNFLNSNISMPIPGS